MDYLLHQIINSTITLVLIVIIGGWYSHMLQKKLISRQENFQTKKLKLELLSPAIENTMEAVNDCAWWFVEIKNEHASTSFTNQENIITLRNYRKAIKKFALLYPEIDTIVQPITQSLKTVYTTWRSHSVFDSQQITRAINELWETNRNLKTLHDNLIDFKAHK